MTPASSTPESRTPGEQSAQGIPNSAATRAWGTNCTPEEAAKFLKSARSAALLTHAKPDGDAAGSTIALARTLRQIGVSTTVVYIAPVPRWLSALASELEITILATGDPMKRENGSPFVPPAVDAIVVVDTGTWTQIAEVKPWVSALAERTLIIDHHLNGNAEMAQRRIVTTSAASCTEALAPLICNLLGLDSPSQLPLPIAEPLYLGLGTDTGWLRYSSVTPATLRLAADLIETGVDHTHLYAMIEQQDLASRWQLLGRALRTLELHKNGRVATMTLSVQDFKETGADRNDTSGFADMLLTVASVQLSVVLTEQEPGSGGKVVTKLSLRSKPGVDAIDVNALAGQIGGGGHARAAGAKVNGPLATAKNVLLEHVS